MTGPAGSGKTLLLAEAFKMSVAKYKKIGKPIKVIISTYHTSAKSLKADLISKFDLQFLIDEFDVNPMSFEELSKGIQT